MLPAHTQVKAVVLRINSPGGSAVASDMIAREVQLLKEAGKPVVACMGDVAASGGYYIAGVLTLGAAGARGGWGCKCWLTVVLVPNTATSSAASLAHPVDYSPPLPACLCSCPHACLWLLRLLYTQLPATRSWHSQVLSQVPLESSLPSSTSRKLCRSMGSQGTQSQGLVTTLSGAQPCTHSRPSSSSRWVGGWVRTTTCPLVLVTKLSGLSSQSFRSYAGRLAAW